MKKVFFTIALLAATASVFAATPKRLASITEVEYNQNYLTSFSYDESGRLNKIVDDTSVITIDYSNLANGKITLKNVDGYEISTFDITVNQAGQATSVTENDYEGDVINWEFTYSDNKLVKIITQNGTDIEYANITWNDGLIASYVETESYDTDVTTATFSYTGITNRGNMPLYDEVYGIDLDELEYIAMAGFMGDTPRELPTGVTYQDEDGRMNIIANWETDAEGYPTKLSSPQEPNEHTLFVWEADNSDVKTITIDNNSGSSYYTIDGVRIDNPTSGIVIEKKADGSTVKHIIKR